MPPCSTRLVITHDSIAEGVHFLPSDPPASVGWKLVAVNLSDLAAKGATPAGALLSLTISGRGRMGARVPRRDRGRVRKLRPAADRRRHDRPAAGAPRVLGLTAIGRAGKAVPDRAGAKPGDSLWLVGTVGDAAAGLALLREDRNATGPLVDIYRRPVPLLGAGQVARAPRQRDDGRVRRPAARRAAHGASEPLRGFASTSTPCRCRQRSSPSAGPDLDARLFAATGGDDYALLAALPPDSIRQHFLYQTGPRSSGIGTLEAGDRASVRLISDGQPGRRCRRDLVLSIRTISIAGFPLRQWLIGLSGLASGMTLALLLH